MNEISPLRNDQLLKINEQMTKSLCVIDFGEGKGTGFFCKIPFPDNLHNLPVIIILKKPFTLNLKTHPLNLICGI